VDPLGWAGLDKVPATDAEREAVLRDRIDDLAGRLEVLDEEISTARIRLRGLHEQSRAARAHADIREWSRERRAELDRAQRDLAATIAQRSRLAEERDASQEFLISTPLPDPPGAHLRNPHLPHSIVRDRRLRFLRVWAAVSVPLLILGAGVLLARPTPALLTGFAVFLVVFTAVEAIARRRVLAFLTGFTVLALFLIVLFALVVGLLRNWQVVLAGLLTLAALVLLMVNLREFRRR
jgi:thiol:disulfide interchange protein